MNADDRPLEPLGQQRVDPQGVRPEFAAVAHEQVVEHAVRRVAFILPEISVDDLQLPLWHKRANQVDYISLPFDHRDAANVSVRAQSVDDQTQAKAGAENMARIEEGVPLHRPPVRRIVNHPAPIGDQQPPDLDSRRVELLVAPQPVAFIEATVSRRLNPRSAESAIGVVGGRRVPSVDRQHGHVLPQECSSGGAIPRIVSSSWRNVKSDRMRSMGLDLYVVYRNPREFPGQFVIRRQTADRGSVTIDPQPTAVGPTLDAVLSMLPPGLTRLERDPNDDPCVVEVWL